MPTLVAFHAHPDDESISTGGTLARAAAAGNRVVVVTATDGSRSGVPRGFLRDGQNLADVRRHELRIAAGILGVARVEMLGYRDSGMMGAPENSDAGCFWQAKISEAARRLAQILEGEEADVLTVYDHHGFYGHPDHIQVHRVGHVAAQMAATPRVFEVTISREHRSRLMPPTKPILLGTPDAGITTAVDVSKWLGVKKEAMVAHASQVDTESWYLNLSPAMFAAVFGTEWFIRTRPVFSGSIPADLEEWLWT